jgi:hypothetical protein
LNQTNYRELLSHFLADVLPFQRLHISSTDFYKLNERGQAIMPNVSRYLIQQLIANFPRPQGEEQPAADHTANDISYSTFQIKSSSNKESGALS